MAQVFFAANTRYLINEKGALAEATTVPFTFPGLTQTVVEIWAAIGAREFGTALQLLRTMAADLHVAVRRANDRL